jgi:hypothetical protein
MGTGWLSWRRTGPEAGACRKAQGATAILCAALLLCPAEPVESLRSVSERCYCWQAWVYCSYLTATLQSVRARQIYKSLFQPS